LLRCLLIDKEKCLGSRGGKPTHLTLNVITTEASAKHHARSTKMTNKPERAQKRKRGFGGFQRRVRPRVEEEDFELVASSNENETGPVVSESPEPDDADSESEHGEGVSTLRCFYIKHNC
jgi:hypothetical protein